MSIIIDNNTRKSAQSGGRKKRRNRKAVVVVNSAPPSQRQRKRVKNANKKASMMYTGVNSLSNRIRVHPCVTNFAMAVANPWDTYSIPGDVCIPDENDIPSFKFRVRQRGTLTTGSSFGFITGNPIAFADSSLASLMFSNSNSFVTTVVPNTGAVAGTITTTSPSPFNGGVIGTMPRIRCVAYGIRVRYSGTELNRGGSIIPYRARLIGTASTSSLGFSQIAETNQATIQPVKRKWVGTVWSPVSANDRTYFLSTAAIEVTNQAQKMVTIAIAAPGTSVTFDFDVVGYYEAIPNTSSSGVVYPPPSVSASDSDVDGYSFVRDAYAKFSDSQIGQAAWDALMAAGSAYVASKVPFGSSTAARAIEW